MDYDKYFLRSKAHAIDNKWETNWINMKNILNKNKKKKKLHLIQRMKTVNLWD